MLLQELSRSRLLDTFREMEKLQARMNRLFEGQFAGLGAPEFPPMNVWTSPEGAIVQAEVPGMEPDEIDISVVNETLTVRGSRPEHQLNEGEKWHRRERAARQFSRTIQLPFRIDADKVEAKFTSGILEIRLPRSEQDKPRKITVNVG